MELEIEGLRALPSYERSTRKLLSLKRDVGTDSPDKMEDYMPVPVYSSPLDSGRAKPQVHELVRHLSVSDISHVYSIPKSTLVPTAQGSRIHTNRSGGGAPERRDSYVDLNCLTTNNS